VKVASDWVARMGSDQRTQGDEQSLQAWLREDPANVQEFDAQAALFNGVGLLADDVDARAVLMGHQPSPVAGAPPSRRLALGAGLGGLAAVVAGVGFARLFIDGAQVFETKPGEQRRLNLADGSKVVLNTGSKLRVRYDAAERRLFLDRGQVWFQVAKAAHRPFRVFVGRDEVRALGTAFDIRRDGDTARVTLEEGAVAIFRGVAERPIPTSTRSQASSLPIAGEHEPALILKPGEEVKIDPNAVLQVSDVDLTRIQAWRSGQLILDSTPLGDAVADFNRYDGVQLVLSDRALASLPVSGVFHTNRPEAFAESLVRSFPLIATTKDGEIVLSRQR
jgi:transmembrane sensor